MFSFKGHQYCIFRLYNLLRLTIWLILVSSFLLVSVTIWGSKKFCIDHVLWRIYCIKHKMIWFSILISNVIERKSWHAGLCLNLLLHLGCWFFGIFHMRFTLKFLRVINIHHSTGLKLPSYIYIYILNGFNYCSCCSMAKKRNLYNMLLVWDSNAHLTPQASSTMTMYGMCCPGWMGSTSSLEKLSRAWTWCMQLKEGLEPTVESPERKLLLPTQEKFPRPSGMRKDDTSYQRFWSWFEFTRLILRWLILISSLSPKFLQLGLINENISLFL